MAISTKIKAAINEVFVLRGVTVEDGVIQVAGEEASPARLHDLLLAHGKPIIKSCTQDVLLEHIEAIRAESMAPEAQDVPQTNRAALTNRLTADVTFGKLHKELINWTAGRKMPPIAGTDKMLGLIKFAVDSTKQVNYIFSGKQNYSMLGPEVMSSTVATCATYAGVHNVIIEAWENKLCNLREVAKEFWNTHVHQIAELYLTQCELGVNNPDLDDKIYSDDSGNVHVCPPYSDMVNILETHGMHKIIYDLFAVNVETKESTRSKTWIKRGKQENAIIGIVELMDMDFSLRTSSARFTYYDYVAELVKRYGTYSFEKIEMPRIYSNTEKAFNTFDVTPYQIDDETELSEDWADFFSKYTSDETEIFLARIWGVVYAKNRSRQAIWIYDPHGYSGKSAFIKAMMKILGENLVGVIQKDSLGNQFGMAKIWDKRLVVYPDCKNTKFMHTEKAHQITGGDPADIENKGEKSFTVVMEASLIIASNEMPDIDPSKKHEMSRTILLKPKMTDKVLQKIAVKDADGNYVRDLYGAIKTTGDEGFVSRLVESAPTMLINAYQAYKRLCPRDADFNVPDSVLANAYAIDTVENTSSDIIFNDIFELGEGYFLSNADALNAYMSYCKSHSNFNNKASNQEFGNFKAFMTKNKGLEPTRLNDAARTRGLMGVRVNPAHILNMNSSIQRPTTLQQGFSK